MITFKTNTSEIMAFARKLEDKRRSAFPVTVRQTLNSTAFAMRDEIPKVYRQKGFNERKPFIKNIRGVEQAQGFNVNSMVAMSGIRDLNSKATTGMKTQESGGNVKKTVIASEKARVGSNWNKRVQTKNTLNRKGAFPTQRIQKGGKGQSRILVKAGAKIAKRGGGLLWYGDSIYEVVNFRRGHQMPVVMNHLYNYYRSPKDVKITGKHLIRDSAKKAKEKMDAFFKEHAQKQLLK